MGKSAAFGLIHLVIAFSLSYALTGSVAIAGTITLVEPLVNTVAHYFFDRWWGHPALLRLGARLKARTQRCTRAGVHSWAFAWAHRQRRTPRHAAT